jgi:hypothetical protein
MMKKLNIIAGLSMLLIPLAMTSCKKEVPLSEAIIGQWEVQEKTVVIYENDIKKESITDFLGANEEVYQFAEGGTGIYNENGDIVGLFSWTINGNTLTFQGTDALECSVTVDNDMLIWSYSAVDTQDATIKYDYIITAKKIS